MSYDEMGQIINETSVDNFQEPESGTITNGPNIVEEQPPHDHPKTEGASRPSRPREEGDANRGMSDKDYRDPNIRTNSYYGPVTATQDLTDNLDRLDKISKSLRGEDQKLPKPDTNDTSDNKPQGGSQEATSSYQSVADKIAKGDYDEKDNAGNEIYYIEGKKVVIGSQEDAQKWIELLGGVKAESKDLTTKIPEEDASHKEALDSNTIANEGFNPLKPMSDTGKDFFARQDQIAQEAKLEQQIDNSEEINPEISELRNEVRALNQQVSDLANMVQELLDNRVTPTPEIPSDEPVIIDVQARDVPTPHSDNLPPTDPLPIEFVDKGLETPEQKLIAVTKRYDELNNRTNLTAEETLEKQRLLSESFALNQQINKERTETDRKRERKEKIVKIVAGVAGAGLAIATPPVAIAAVLGVTLGGRIATPLIKYGSNKLRERSNNAKYENRIGLSPDELGKLDKKIKRNEWWANRLGELAALVDGGTMGYGLGKFAQNMFGWKGINFDGNNIDTPKLSSDVSAYDKQAFSRYNNQLGQNTPNIPQTPTGGEIPTAKVELGNWLDTSKYNWPWQEYGWRGPQLALAGNGGTEGMMQGEFVKSLFGNGVTDQMLQNPEAGKIFAQSLRSLYNGGSATELGQSAAQQIINLSIQ